MELGADTTFARSTRRRRRQRTILLVALGVALLGSAGAWLAASGVTAPSITPPAGLPSSGAVADVDATGLSGQITLSQGNAQINQGIPVTRVIVANGYEDKLRATIGWTNASTAGSFLHGNDQISVGLYYPVSVTSGSCTSSNTLKVTDSHASAGAVCVVLDPAGSGSYSLNSATNTIMLSQHILGGYVTPSASAGTTSTCPTDNGSQTAWCDPAGTVVDNSSGTPSHNQHVLYVLATVLNPANHAPQGQQASSGSLTFYVQVKRVS